MNGIKKRKRGIVCVMGYIYLLSNRNEIQTTKKRSKWVKNWIAERDKFGHMPLLRELRNNDPDDFKSYLRMDSETFDHLLGLVKPYLIKQDTVMRKSIPPDERLVATLRFLATGRCYEDLKFSTGIAAQTLGYLIPETCRVLFEVLQEKYMKFPRKKEDWAEIALNFKNRWQMINCGGALDGKHVRIVPPPHSGAQYYNYKQFYSVVLLGLVNANYEFIYVDVGKQGRLSDGGVIDDTVFNTLLKANKLNFPTNVENDENLNFVIVGDEAFALNKHILKPYPQKNLTYERRVYNYRLSRARNVVEQSFGLISSRFRILHTSININPVNINYVILAVCVLHNYLRKKCSSYITPTTFDRENSITHEIELGDWRKECADLVSLQPINKKSVPLEAKVNRDNYLTFFNNKGKVDWQDEMIKMGKA